MKMRLCLKCFIELCDGWYAIRALCDTYLAECVRKKRLRVGDKLAIFSSELVGCPKDGCAPLEVRTHCFSWLGSLLAHFVNDENCVFIKLTFSRHPSKCISGCP